MHLKNNILPSFFAGLLSILLLLPSFLEFAHTLEGHEHIACDDVSTHIHKKNLDCSLCDFQFSTFQFNLISFQENSNSEIFIEQQISFISSEKTTDLHNFHLRGPPSIS